MGKLKQTIPFCIGLLVLGSVSCHSYLQVRFPLPSGHRITGAAFYRVVANANWKERDSVALNEILSGNLPDFFKNFVPVPISVTDSFTGKVTTATFYVSPDYLSIGTNEDWVRIPLTPMAAQRIADSFDCFLPTRKMVNEIYNAAVVKIEPVPMITSRDSSATMYKHHLLIEEQRKGRSGLIAGIKKDVVISEKITKDARPNRVAIYGWHKLDGKPIQPLHTGHVNWYVDYSHGVRLVHRKIKVAGKWMDYTDVLRHPQLKRLLCDEEDCNFIRYIY